MWNIEWKNSENECVWKKRITDKLTKWNTILFMISSKSWRMNIYTTLNIIFFRFNRYYKGQRKLKNSIKIHKSLKNVPCFIDTEASYYCKIVWNVEKRLNQWLAFLLQTNSWLIKSALIYIEPCFAQPQTPSVWRSIPCYALDQ